MFGLECSKCRSAIRLVVLFLTLQVTALPASAAAPTRLIVLGDSLSAEYDSISGFSGIDDPTEYAAITAGGWESMSWVEVVGRLRSESLDLGGFKSELPGWGLFRFSGYEYNFAIPGFTAEQFKQVVSSSIFSHPEFLSHKQQLSDALQNNADAAVVWLGGNEFRGNYGTLYEGASPAGLINNLSNDLAQVVDWVRGRKVGLKLVIVNLPDLGATPDKQAAHPDPLKRANVTAATVLANQAIASIAAARGLPVADVFSDTKRLIDGETLWLGPVNLLPGSHPDNHHRHHFTRDGLHPNTCLQAIMARRILETLNQAHGTDIPTLTDVELLGLVGINPLQPYLDWTTTNQLAATGIGDDGDADGLVNLAEFVFLLDPNAVSAPPLKLDASATPLKASFSPDAGRLRLVEVKPEWSSELSEWAAVPMENINVDANGLIVTLPPDEFAGFIRLQLSVRPVQ
ncbi:MAG TPA: hypothetical protein DCY13_09810 [Verrucomicrobiales bacterium]|nr:hypothetical protein [Verrucomicrobiales bacterium]